MAMILCSYFLYGKLFFPSFPVVNTLSSFLYDVRIFGIAQLNGGKEKEKLFLDINFNIISLGLCLTLRIFGGNFFEAIYFIMG